MYNQDSAGHTSIVMQRLLPDWEASSHAVFGFENGAKPNLGTQVVTLDPMAMSV